MTKRLPTPTPFPAPISLEQTLLPGTSRYHGQPILKLELPDGSEVAYLDRRFLPSPDDFDTLTMHVVAEKERPDHVAHNYLNNAEFYWRIADVNPVLDPSQLTDTPGGRIRIGLPEGISGADYA